jgi:cysteinyl-tRNA synthetase
MPLRFYNTLTRKKEAFKPIKKGAVCIYTCGPTTYDYAHIGNFRSYVFEDLLRRYLKYRGYKVKQVMNLTDVDDKTIKGSRKEKKSLNEFTERYKKAFFEDLDRLNIERAEVYPEATKHIKQMVGLIKTLLKKGFAYKGKDGSIYFDISKFKGYGKLSKLKIKKLKAGARVSQDEYDKANASDFALWKAWSKSDGSVCWETEIGKGRPGWHIECSAMSMHYLGETFDIHCGGVDLIFPHHENEIAQSEAATGKQFVRYWLHNEHLVVDGKKMSKSLGNFYTLRDLKDYDPLVIRYVLLSTHYRQQLDFTFKKLKEAEHILERLREFVRNLMSVKGDGDDGKVGELVKDAKKGFEDALDDDLNIALSLKHFFRFVGGVSKMVSENKLDEKDAEKALKTVLEFDKVFGLRLDEIGEVWHPLDEAESWLKEMILKREGFRKERKWKEADKIRDELGRKGIVLEDRESGPRWRKV